MRHLKVVKCSVSVTEKFKLEGQDYYHTAGILWNCLKIQDKEMFISLEWIMAIFKYKHFNASF